MAPIPLPAASSDIQNPQFAPYTRIASLIRRAASAAPSLPKLSSLVPRQNTIAIPASYSNLTGGPSPGTVVGIVIGSVGGFLLIIYLLYSISGNNRAGSVSSESVVVHERRKSTRASSSRRHSHSETVEVRSAPSRPVVERVVMQERVVRPEVVRSESTRSGDDEVVVIEEHSPPRRSKSKRDSGYRTVDPLAYGGGDRPLREVRKSSGSRRG